MKKSILIFGFTLAILSSCSTAGVGGASKASSLAGEWKLQADNDVQMGMNETPITISFDTTEAGQMGGFAGCNNYGGGYSTVDDTMNFQGVFATKRACPDLQTESQFLSLLDQVDRYEIKGKDLYLYKGNLVLLHFVK